MIMAFSPVRSAGSLLCAGNARIPSVGLRTTDRLEEMLARDYSGVARGLLRPGELIYVSTSPRRERDGGAERGEVRLALVMVRAEERSPAQADGSVRLVQDFGRPDDPAETLISPVSPWPATAMEAPAAPPKRGRGRPPGSRTEKPE
jgi:hypothetical protein